MAGQSALAYYHVDAAWGDTLFASLFGTQAAFQGAEPTAANRAALTTPPEAFPFGWMAASPLYEAQAAGGSGRSKTECEGRCREWWGGTDSLCMSQCLAGTGEFGAGGNVIERAVTGAASAILPRVGLFLLGAIALTVGLVAVTRE